MKTLFIIYYLSLIASLISTKTVLQRYDLSIRGFIISLYTNSRKTAHVFVNQSQNYSLFRASRDDYQSISRVNLTVEGETFPVNITKKKFSFNKEIETPDNFFYYIYDSLFVASNLFSFGLGLNFDNKNYSIVHTLKDQGYIDYLSYTIIHPRLENSYWGNVIFGDYYNKTFSRHQSGECQPNINLKEWNCELKRIKIKNLVYEVPSSITFDSSKENIYVPKTFYNYLGVVLEKYFEKNICSKHNNQVMLSYGCLIEIRKDPSIVEFQIGDFIYSIPFSDFFTSSIYSTSLFEMHFGKEEEWIIGSNFLRHFDLKFDYEKKKIYFYSSKDNIMDVGIRKPNYAKIGYILTSCLLAAFVIFNFSVKKFFINVMSVK